MSGRRIDAHLHLWNLARAGYPWLKPSMTGLYRDFDAKEAFAELTIAGFSEGILVQAEDSLDETRFLLDIAERVGWVAAVTGWVPLDDPIRTARALEMLAEHARLRGVRHLVHDDPRDGFFAMQTVRSSLRQIAAHGLVLEVPDAWPRHLRSVRDLAEALPELSIVIDHLAKPPVGEPDFEDWSSEFAAIAKLPNVATKFSGLYFPGPDSGIGTLRTLLHTTLESFGPERVIYGSDWPISVAHGGYQAIWRAMRACLHELSEDEQSLVLGGNAERIYRC